MDGRSEVNTSFDFFGCFQNEGFSEKSFLASSVLPDETDLRRTVPDSISAFIESTLRYYEKTRSEVKFIVSDNEPTMRAVAKKLMIQVCFCRPYMAIIAITYGKENKWI